MRIETGNNIAVAARQAAEGRYARPERDASTAQSRALVPVEPPARAGEAEDAPRRAVAPATLVTDALLAVQLIAAKLDLPQARTLRRATAHEGEAAYDATAAVIHRRGPRAGAGLDIGA